jgi:hypothetical protein
MSYYQRYSSLLLKRLTSCQTQRSAAVPALLATGTTYPTTIHPATSSYNITTRYKHSSRQIKRLFKNNPVRRRIDQKNRDGAVENDINIPPAQFAPVLLDNLPKILPNGWNPPPSEDIQKTLPIYPFQVSRTKNKPNNAVGFLPVYSEFR